LEKQKIILYQRTQNKQFVKLILKKNIINSFINVQQEKI